MRRLPIRSLAGLGLLFLALGAQAQVSWRVEGRYDRDGRGNRRGGSPVEQALADLNYAESAAYPSHGVRKHFDHARKELWDFQRAWNERRFDRHELDEAISAMQKVVNTDGLRPNDRVTLVEDLHQLREMRLEYSNSYPRW